MKNINKEWYITVPWGKLALASWGDPTGEPILLVHGRQDSLSTFIPLLEYLPDHYHYVGFDSPGNGKSDAFPSGVMFRFLFVVALDYVVSHLKWKKFGYISHSMGSSQGLFYNAIKPGRITKMVLLDPIPSMYTDFTYNTVRCQKIYKEYYDKYEKYTRDDRVYTKSQALSAVMNARGLSKEQAELVLERNLKPVGDDQYQLSWDRRFRILASQFNAPEYYYQLFSRHQPPTLVINASQSIPPNASNVSIDFIKRLDSNSPDFFIKRVQGNHDSHIMNAVDVAKEVNWFLKKYSVKCRL